MQSILIHHVITLLLLTGWCLITAGTGHFFLRFTSLRPVCSGEQVFLSLGMGLIVSGYSVFVLGCLQWLHPAGILALLFLLALLTLVEWFRLPVRYPAPPARPIFREHWAVLLLLGLLSAGFLLVLTPETGKDALIYHLAVPRRYLLEHSFHFLPGNIFAGYPLLGEMQYLLALFLQGDILAKLMNYTLLGAILLGIGLLVRTIESGHSFPALSMLIFASIPSVFAVSHAAYNDLFVTFFTLAAVYAFLRWWPETDRGWLILCSLFSGAAAACKYTALLLPLLGCLGLLWRHNQRKARASEALRDLAVYAALAFIAASPFYLKNWILLGNPFYPFFYDLFGGRGWDADQARLYNLFINELGMGRGVTDYLLLPWNLSLRAEFDSPHFDGILGPVFLLTLPFLLGSRHWGTQIRILLAFSLATFLFWASSAQQIRYLIHVFPLLAIVTGAILTRYRDRRPLFTLLILLIAGSLAFNVYSIARDFIKIRPVAVAAGLETRESFLARLIPTYPMYRLVNETLPPDSHVFLLYMKNFNFLCDRSCYSDAMFEAHTLQKILDRSPSPTEVRRTLVNDGFTHLLYDEAYLLGEPSPLSDRQKALFKAFRDSGLTLLHQQGSYRLERIQ